MRNIILGLAAVAILLGIEVHTAFISYDQPRCDVYREVQRAWYICSNPTRSSLLENPHGVAENQCRQKETDMACMRDKFASCDNIDDIMAAMGATFSYCNGSTVDTVFSNYLTYEYTLPDWNCTWKMIRSGEKCAQPVYEPFDDGNLSLNNGMQQAYKLVTAVISCLGSFMEIPTVPECGMQSGLKAVTDLLVMMVLDNGVGSATYERFQALLLKQYSNTWSG